MSIIDFFFGRKKEPIDLTNAIVLDVRSKSEYASGHVPGSINIPLPELKGQLNRLPKGKRIVTCCASGMRSATATSMLREAGYDVANGGGWQSLV